MFYIQFCVLIFYLLLKIYNTNFIHIEKLFINFKHKQRKKNSLEKHFPQIFLKFSLKARFFNNKERKKQKR